MTKPVYKVLLFVKRNPNLSVEEFRHLYETVHAPYCLKYFDKACIKYMRRYTTLVGAPHADVTELDFDAIVEMWYSDSASAQATAERVAQHKLPEDVLPHEARMFDRAKIRSAMVVDYETDPATFGAGLEQKGLA